MSFDTAGELRQIFANSRLREYELRDHLETLQDRTVEELTAELPAQGDSTNTITDGQTQAGVPEDNDAAMAHEAGSNSQQRGTPSHKGSEEAASISQDTSQDEDYQKPHYNNHLERERSATIGAA
ncbi:hypothetical protein P389DRAFT_207944 [Cystobasidium minutum MCA 4210]|uniref:uncharacterized protein n=1 Tax=Cystobasidium minutum MCA 4210 TaxID=1397322 RepID=UPI0034D0179B|eukprot:jgi/Rhomi1/207944/estExt_Genemark1.C_1_t20430